MITEKIYNRKMFPKSPSKIDVEGRYSKCTAGLAHCQVPLVVNAL